ncbi:MAG: M28 family peptidase [Oscillospiraceae bacterium]|nr:M28 family peptidase [Oscillospiraceae bacterium]
MLKVPMDVLSHFPVRKSAKQKKAFREAVESYANDLGYRVTIESGSLGSRNVVIGDPNPARYLVTAHYDTCARLPFPNLITPCNLVTFILYQILTVAVMFAFVLAVGTATYLITQDPQATYWTSLLSMYLFLILIMVGPANKHNANDNTSGVVTLLEIARSLPNELRNKVCFVLFDLEEVGLVGSASYRSNHKKATNDQIILNLDCVGDGDELVMFPTGRLKKDRAKMRQLIDVERSCNEKSLRVHQKGFSIYPSDQANFPYGVGIAAFHRAKGVGLYCSRIHTHRDTILEEANVNFLRTAIISVIAGDDHI